MAKSKIRQPASSAELRRNLFTTIPLKDLKIFMDVLNHYIREKESLTRDNIISHSLRGSFFGFFTSIIPILSLNNFLRNYAEKKGVFYKIVHLFTPYKPGGRVVLPGFRAFLGARIKDWLTSKPNTHQLIIRQRNMGYAHLLTVKLDYLIHGDIPPALKETEHQKFNQFVSDQIQIKRNRGQTYDSYFMLLNQINSRIKARTSLTDTILEKEPRRLKARILDTLAETTVRDDFIRGYNYNFENLSNELSIDEFDAPKLASTYKRLSNLLMPRENKPVAVTDPRPLPTNKPQPIRLSKVIRKCDQMIGVKLNPEIYRKSIIIGADNQGRLVGENFQLLQNGWYQFVITEENGKPSIRYNLCGESRKHLPFIHQQTVKPARSSDGYYKRISKDPVLKYEKYHTHTELSGGLDVLGAGAIKVVNGLPEIIEDSSGHYPVSGKFKDQYIYLEYTHSLLKSYGVNVSDTILEHWKPYHGLDKMLKKFTSVRTAKDPQLAELRATPPGSPTPIRNLIEKSSPPTMRCR